MYNINFQIVYWIYLKVKLGPVFALGGASPGFKVGEKLVVLGQEVSLNNDNKVEKLEYLRGGVGENKTISRGG